MNPGRAIELSVATAAGAQHTHKLAIRRESLNAVVPPVCNVNIAEFIDGLELPDAVKAELKTLSPANYIGDAIRLVDQLPE